MKHLVLLSLLAGCFESIKPTDTDAGLAITGGDGPFATTRATDGTYVTVVDATSTSAWTYGDFETGAAVTDESSWDLRFQRFHISTNGGVSGDGGVEVALVSDLAFEDVVVPPVTGWTADLPDGDDTNADPDYAFEQGDGWYDYDANTHVLTPKRVVWVVRTNGGTTLKLRIERYYDEAGTAGWFTLRWAPI